MPKGREASTQAGRRCFTRGKFCGHHDIHCGNSPLRKPETFTNQATQAIQDVWWTGEKQVTTASRVFRYRISKTAVVNPEDVYVLDPTDHPTMTLVTCYPFEFIGHAPQRYIVSADLLTEAGR